MHGLSLLWFCCLQRAKDGWKFDASFRYTHICLLDAWWPHVSCHIICNSLPPFVSLSLSLEALKQRFKLFPQLHPSVESRTESLEKRIYNFKKQKSCRQWWHYFIIFCVKSVLIIIFLLCNLEIPVNNVIWPKSKNSFKDQKAQFKVTFTSSQPLKFDAHDIRYVVKMINSINMSGQQSQHWAVSSKRWLQTMNNRLRLIRLGLISK